MQEDFALNRTFFHRTNLLAAKLGLQVEDLAEIMGIGRRTLFECRSADSKASPKSWSRLEVAERKAIIQSAPPTGIAQSEANPKYPTAGFRENMVGEDPPLYRVKSAASVPTAPSPALSLDERLERIERALLALVDAVNSNKKET